MMRRDSDSRTRAVAFMFASLEKWLRRLQAWFAIELRFGTGAELFEQLNQRGALGLAEPARRPLHGGLVDRKGSADVRFALHRQLHDPRATVAGIETASHEPARLQAIHRAGDGATRELDLTPDLIDLLRP